MITRNGRIWQSSSIGSSMELPNPQFRIYNWHRRERLVGKEWAVAGDGIFTFNVVGEQQRIEADVPPPPRKQKDQRKLTHQQLLDHSSFSHLRIIVENAIGWTEVLGLLGLQTSLLPPPTRSLFCSLDQCIVACMVMEQWNNGTSPAQTRWLEAKCCCRSCSHTQDGSR